MTSERKHAANRANAGRSTGPRSTAGKRRSGQNAREHGLNIPVRFDAAWAPRVQELVRALAGGDEARLAGAHAAAEAQAHLERISAMKQLALRLAIAQLREQRSEPPESIEARAHIAAVPQLLKLDNYERKARSRLKRALRGLREGGRD